MKKMDVQHLVGDTGEVFVVVVEEKTMVTPEKSISQPSTAKGLFEFLPEDSDSQVNPDKKNTPKPQFVLDEMAGFRLTSGHLDEQSSSSAKGLFDFLPEDQFPAKSPKKKHRPAELFHQQSRKKKAFSEKDLEVGLYIQHDETKDLAKLKSKTKLGRFAKRSFTKSKIDSGRCGSLSPMSSSNDPTQLYPTPIMSTLSSSPLHSSSSQLNSSDSWVLGSENFYQVGRVSSDLTSHDHLFQSEQLNLSSTPSPVTGHSFDSSEPSQLAFQLQGWNHALARVLLEELSHHGTNEKKNEVQSESSILIDTVLHLHGRPLSLFCECFQNDLKVIKNLATVMREQNSTVAVWARLCSSFSVSHYVSAFSKLVGNLGSSSLRLLANLTNPPQPLEPAFETKLREKLNKFISSILVPSLVPPIVCFFSYQCSQIATSYPGVINDGIVSISNWVVSNLYFLRFVIPSITTYALSRNEIEKKAGIFVGKFLMKMCSNIHFRQSPPVISETLEASFSLFNNYCQELVQKGQTSKPFPNEMEMISHLDVSLVSLSQYLDRGSSLREHLSSLLGQEECDIGENLGLKPSGSSPSISYNTQAEMEQKKDELSKSVVLRGRSFSNATFLFESQSTCLASHLLSCFQKELGKALLQMEKTGNRSPNTHSKMKHSPLRHRTPPQDRKNSARETPKRETEQQISPK